MADEFQRINNFLESLLSEQVLQDSPLVTKLQVLRDSGAIAQVSQGIANKKLSQLVLKEGLVLRVKTRFGFNSMQASLYFEVDDPEQRYPQVVRRLQELLKVQKLSRS